LSNSNHTRTLIRHVQVNCRNPTSRPESSTPSRVLPLECNHYFKHLKTTKVLVKPPISERNRELIRRSTAATSFPSEMADNMSSITPSPSPPNSGPAASRRPPRKSTLTQQQKNQKRQRATQEQLITLEAEFNKNPTPTAVVRERIAQEINMTERSVQIWFQNRWAIPSIPPFGVFLLFTNRMRY
jgi:hypothetical protein